MNLNLALSLALCLIGAVIYVLPTPPKAQELGRLSFAVGLLAFLLKFAGVLSLSTHN